MSSTRHAWPAQQVAKSELALLGTQFGGRGHRGRHGRSQSVEPTNVPVRAPGPPRIVPPPPLQTVCSRQKGNHLDKKYIWADTTFAALPQRIPVRPARRPPMQLPLLFTFKKLVIGKGFIAGVMMSGRALLEEEDNEVWISGVAPVGITGGGPSRDDAFAEYRKRWVSVLFDIAADAESFSDFQAQCSEFLTSSLPHLTEEWELALREVRKKKYTDATLRTESADKQPVHHEIVELEPSSFTPGDNVLDQDPDSGVKAAA